LQILTWDDPIAKRCENSKVFDEEYYFGSPCNWAAIAPRTFVNGIFQGAWTVNTGRGWVPVFLGTKIVGTCHTGGNIHPSLVQFRCPLAVIQVQQANSGSVIFQPAQPRVCARTYSNTQIDGAVTIFGQKWHLSNQSGNSAEGCN